jgi:hypothetical protein
MRSSAEKSHNYNHAVRPFCYFLLFLYVKMYYLIEFTNKKLDKCSTTLTSESDNIVLVDEISPINIINNSISLDILILNIEKDMEKENIKLGNDANESAHAHTNANTHATIIETDILKQKPDGLYYIKQKNIFRIYEKSTSYTSSYIPYWGYTTPVITLLKTLYITLYQQQQPINPFFFNINQLANNNETSIKLPHVNNTFVGELLTRTSLTKTNNLSDIDNKLQNKNKSKTVINKSYDMVFNEMSNSTIFKKRKMIVDNKLGL